ncbi:Tellurite resistance protein TehB [hydrothermal vent metagenome]|uniref:Tellurite resistance protein TehB n=1 Tax=hydrothermal vent metagenome TaxID=652676 RepID=A0A3B0Y5N6_9ZZZZ
MWDERYSAEHYIYGTEPNEFLLQNINEIPAGGEVLCLADGEGRNSVFLAKQGYSVTAIDSSIEGIKKARRLADKHNVNITFIHQDLENYEPGINHWHGIVSIFCHLPLEIRQPLHQKIVNSLKNNGVLILEAYTPEQIKLGTGGPPIAALTMDSSTLKKELKGLHFKQLQELQREVIEGTHHTGTGAVVQTIAIKKTEK